jgi:predicted RNase H-like HicB family nuclease
MCEARGLDRGFGGRYNPSMKVLHYTVILEREEEGGYHAFVPALKGCHSQGDTLEDAIANIQEAAEVYLESLKAEGETPPEEDILIKPLEVAA